MRWASLLLVVLWVWLAPAFAEAEIASGVPTENDSASVRGPGDRRLLWALNAGIASALGFAGLSLAYLYECLEVEGGLGFGMSGVQISLMPKLSIGTDRHRFLFGAGAAVAFPTGMFTYDVAYPPQDGREG